MHDRSSEHPMDRAEASAHRPPRRLPVFGDLRFDRRLRWIVAVYLVLIACIVGYNAKSIARERGAALIVNIAARQRALGERYQKDVVLRTQGVQADPDDDAAQLLSNADALLHGGDVVAVQGADQQVRIPPASSDPRVIAKLEEEQRLIKLLITAGDRLQPMTDQDPGFLRQLQEVRVIGAQVTSISNDAVGQMTRDTEAAFGN